MGGLSHSTHSRHPHPRTHRHALCLPPRSAQSRRYWLCPPPHPQTLSSRPPQGGHRSSPFRAGQGRVSGAELFSPTPLMAPVGQMCGARREATAGGFLRPPPPRARALSCRCPPWSQPRSRAAAPRSPPPASLPAVFGVGPGSWGTAARRGVGVAGVRVPSRKSRKQSPCPGRVQGECKAWGMVGPCASPSPPQRIWPGLLSAGQTPDQSPLRASKGTLGAGEEGGAVGEHPEWGGH